MRQLHDLVFCNYILFERDQLLHKCTKTTTASSCMTIIPTLKTFLKQDRSQLMQNVMKLQRITFISVGLLLRLGAPLNNIPGSFRVFQEFWRS